MANKVTGSTDTTGALTVAPTMARSVLMVGQADGVTTEANTVFSIVGTADAAEKFGTSSVMVKAVKALIQNGVDNIYGIVVSSNVPAEGKLSDNYASALEASLGEKSVKFIVLDNFDKAIITELKTHLAMAENEDLFRYGVVPPSTNKRDDIIAFAGEINDSRIFVPGAMFSDDDGNTVNSTVVAAGISGAILVESTDPALPINGVAIYGIGSVDRTILESERNMFAQNGVTAIYNDADVVFHRLVTSYTKDAIWQEGTTRFIADYVLENVETVLRANYKRTKNVDRILDAIKTTVKGQLENFEALEIIENFDASTLSVVKDPTDNYGAIVDYEFDVVTPLYTITIDQHMKL